MRVEITMPKMGESVTEGTIIKWNKIIGDAVQVDEMLFEISTDKVDTEIPSPSAGILIEIFVQAEQTVDVGTVVGVIETEKVASPPIQSKKVFAPAEVKEPNNVLSSPAVEEKSVLIDIQMPKMGESVMEGTILRWIKKVGDAVKNDEMIFEISTDKVDTEVPSPAAGVLAEILVNEQETVPVGHIVARIAIGSAVTKLATPEDSMHGKVAENIERISNIAPQGEIPITARVASGQVQIFEQKHEDKFFSPLVVSIAGSHGVSFDELNSIKGTGISGRVTKKDILAYIEVRGEVPIESSKIQSIPPSVQDVQPARVVNVPVPAQRIPVNQPVQFSSAGIERIPMDTIRQRIMQHMIKSRDTSVHVTGLVEVDMTNASALIKKYKDKLSREYGIKLTYMSFVAFAAIRGLQAHPLMNSTIDGAAILKKRFINLGIAVALEPNGLIVPNIKNANEKNLLGIARSIQELAEKSRTKRLTPDDISGGTFTITNYGVFGTLFGTPIINQPEVAILGVGAVVKRPVVIEHDGADMIGIKPMMYLTLSHDHRLIDGMLGGLFLKTMKETLESFSDDNIGL